MKVRVSRSRGAAGEAGEGRVEDVDNQSVKVCASNSKMRCS